ncbi:MAG: HAD family hydrolase [Myxococcota bacterium]
MRYFFFDVGGTMIEPTPSVGAIYHRVGEAFGLGATQSQLENAFRRIFSEHVHRSGDGPLALGTDEPSTHLWWRTLVFQLFDELEFGGDREACYRALFGAFEQPSAWRVFDDVRPAIATLTKAAVPMGIISNWDYRLIPILDALDLRRHFEPIVVSCFEGVAKPSLGLFRAALERVGVPASEVRYVGDRRDLDLEPARALGMDAYLVDRNGAVGDARDTRVVQSLLDLVS